MSVVCDSCSKTFTSERGLKYHSVHCNQLLERKFICKFCGDQLSKKQNLIYHEKNCQVSFELEILKKEDERKILEIETLKKSLKEKDAQNLLLLNNVERFENEVESLKKIIKEKEEQIQILKTTNQNLNSNVSSLVSTVDTSYKTINNVANKSGNTYNQITNTMNYLKPIGKDDFEKITAELIDDHDIVNEKQFARFCMKNGLQNKVIKTDHARKVITYKNEDGNPIKDPKAKELTENIYKTTKTLFQEKAKQYERFNDEQDQVRIDFYTNIATRNKKSMEKFGEELVQEANKTIIPVSHHQIFVDLKETVKQSAFWVFSQGAFDIGEWIREKLNDKITTCRRNVSIKNKYIVIRETKEKIDNKALVEGLKYALSVDNFESLLLEQSLTRPEEKDNIKARVESCKKQYAVLFEKESPNEWENVIIGLT